MSFWMTRCWRWTRAPGRRRSTRLLTAPVRTSGRLRLPDDPLTAPDACVAQEGFGRAVVGALANKCGVLLV